MDDILKRRRSKKYRLYHICQRVLTCIHAKVRMAMTCCSIKYVFYNFRTLNTHGCPMLSFRRSMKMKEYILKQLTQQGFNAKTVFDTNNGIEWRIVVCW